MLSPFFVAGYISATGTFIEYKRNNNIYFAFQIKTLPQNVSLLNQIAAYFEVINRVYNFSQTKQRYAQLIIRNRQVILKTLMPFFDEYLDGYKKTQYLQWKKRFLENCSTWNFRNITSSQVSTEVDE